MYVAKIRKAKKNHFRSLSIKNKKRGGVWRVLKQSPKHFEWSLDTNDQVVTDKSTIAEIFKETFCSKVDRLRKQPCLQTIFNRLSAVYPSPPSWDITSISLEDVLKCIDELKPSGSSGPDLISNKLIKTFKFEIAAPLLQIINGSITHGIFPDIWKQGYVTPIFKRGSRSSPNNCCTDVLPG